MQQIIFETRQFIHQCSEMATTVFLSRARRTLLVRGLVTCQAMKVRHILEDNVGKVMQYVNERCLADKWLLGNLIA